MVERYTPLSIKRQHILGIRERSTLTKLCHRVLKILNRLGLVVFWFCRRPISSTRHVMQIPELLRAEVFAKHWRNINDYDLQSMHNVVTHNPLVEYIEDYSEGPGIFKWK